MGTRLLEWECDRCQLLQVFYMEDHKPEPDTGVRGGWTATKADPDAIEAFADWTEQERCQCVYTERQRADLEIAVADDYDRGYEPWGVG